MSKRIWNRIKREGLVNEIRRLRVKSLFLKNDVYNSLGLKSINKDSSPKYVKSFYGPLMFENWKDVTFRFCIRGSYGTVFSDYLKNYTKPFCFIDIGANQGLYSLIAGNNENCLKVFAFEPVPTTAGILTNNIGANNLGRKSEVHAKAISNENACHKIYINLEHSGATSIDQVTSESQSSQAVDIETVNSSYLDELTIPKDVDIVIKVDVEGHERVVIEQLVQTNFLRDVSAIYYEYDTKIKDDMNAIEGLLRQNDFTSFFEVKDDQTKGVFNVLSIKKAY
jgi:FkbM family methyltransferase